MALSTLDKINHSNTILIIISMVVAMFLPFELFLFSYAILGPLHYLTEVSWLHNKQYYTKKKYDYFLLIVLSLLVALPVLGALLHFKVKINGDHVTSIIYLAVTSSVIFVFIDKLLYRVLAFLVAVITLKFSGSMFLILSVFLPTLIHVFLFTALFMLYGALKTKSKSGYLSFWVMILFPIIALTFFSGPTSYKISDYAFNAYKSFEALNYFSLKQFTSLDVSNNQVVTNNIYFSKEGIILMRFIAFAYTYHYLNWFSKTEVIAWHKVPKRRLLVIFILWCMAIGAYAYDYKTGFQCLFFLSFLHVLLELPLNVVSIKGIINELFSSGSKKEIAKT